MSKGAYSAQTRTRVRVDEPSRCTKPEPFSGLMGQDFEKGVAVVDGTVTVVEPAAAIDEIAELGALEADLRPGHLGDRAGPGLVSEAVVETLAEGAVELCVMGDDEVGRLQQGTNDRHVDRLAHHHFGGNAGQPRDLGANPDRRLVQHAEHADHRADPSLCVVHEGDHAEFDDLVTAVVEAGRLDIDHERDAFARSRPIGGIDRTWFQPPQHTVIIVLVEDLGRALWIERARQPPRSGRSMAGPRLPKRGTVVLVDVVEQVGLGERWWVHCRTESAAIGSEAQARPAKLPSRPTLLIIPSYLATTPQAPGRAMRLSQPHMGIPIWDGGVRRQSLLSIGLTKAF